jgi:hypothetical protein
MCSCQTRCCHLLLAPGPVRAVSNATDRLAACSAVHNFSQARLMYRWGYHLHAPPKLVH